MDSKRGLHRSNTSTTCLTKYQKILKGARTTLSFADQDRVPEGATASGRWVQADSRTMLAGSAADAGQSFLDLSGATGGGGQHS